MNSMGIPRPGNAVACVGLISALMANGCTEVDSASRQSLGKLGLSCVLSDEAEPGFSGYGVEETNVQFVSSLCDGNSCVGHHFRGRASCPYGQTPDDIAALDATDPARCRVTDTAGNVSEQPVAVEVLPQLVERRAEKVVYCSCGCSGTDPNHEYCTCPSDMRCEPLLYVTSKWPYTGYCMRLDSLYDKATVSTLACSRTSTDPATDCGNNRQNP